MTDQPENPPVPVNQPPDTVIPVDDAPRTPTTVTYTSSWLYFLMVLCLGVAWFLPIKILVSWWLMPPLRENPRTAYEFVSLSYEGVSGKLNEVSPKRFREHLQALTKGGYVPITLEDVRDLVKKGKPVPAKAVLLTFDHGRKSSYFSVKTMLRKSGWHAVMFVWTKPVVDRDPAVLLWPYVEALTRSKSWEVGAQSHDGFAKMAISDVGEAGHFLTNPQWLAAESRFESREEMQMRIANDFETCFSLIEKQAGGKPLAFAYPYGDFGQYQRAAEFPRRLNLGLVAKHCELAFVSGNFGLNTKNSDPYRLNRLRVKPTWDGAELVSQIERLWSRPDQVGKPAYAAQPTSWAVDEGRLTADTGKLILSATEATAGCRIWLTGSDSFRDLNASLSFVPERGNLGISFRATPDMEQYVYLGFDRTGDVWLRQKCALRAPVTLAYSNLGTIASQKPHKLEVIIRGRMFYALLDGKPVFDKHIELQSTPTPGMFGISAWNTEKNAARVTLYALDLRIPDPILVSWAPEQNGDAHAMSWLHQNAHRFAFLSPPWTPAVPTTGDTPETRSDLGLFQVMSRIHQMQLAPRLDIARRIDLSKWTPAALAEALRPNQCAALFVDLSLLDGKDFSAALQWLRQSDVELKRRSLKLLVRIPAVLRQLPDFKNFSSLLPGVSLVAAAGDPPLDNQPPPVKKEEIPPPKPGTPLPFTYELPEVAKKAGDMQVVDQEKRLLEQGQTAFAHGDYKNAISYWVRLQKMDVANPEPTMLIGDAYLQLGDLDAALLHYRRSLDLDPSRLPLVVRMARILDQKEKGEDARQLLNTYARIFPGNTDIMMAQVAWLERHEQYEEAKQLALRVLSVENTNLQAMGFMLRLASTRDEKLEVLRRLFALENVPDLYSRLAETFWRSDLLNLPESHTLGDLIRRLAQRLPAESDKNPYLRLLPVADGVTENLRERDLSAAWLADGGKVTSAPGRITLVVDPNRTEATLRLLGSDRFRNSFIEVDVGEVTAQFYLYARRGGSHYVRFGFDMTSGTYNLQVYRNAKIVSSVKSSGGRLPSRTGDVVRLRLDLVGDGAMGFVNGEPLFANPVSVPRDGDLGWFGAGIFSPDKGQAKATMEYLAGGPTPVRLALFPEGIHGDDLDQSLSSLRQTLGLCTHLCPIWFGIGPYGNWLNWQNADSDVVRLFARYYRLRLWPAVRVKRDTMVMPADILRMARDQNVDGFILLFDEMPTDKWFDLVHQELRMSAVEVTAVVTNRATGKSDVRPLGAARDWFPMAVIGEKPVDTVSIPQGEDGTYVLPERLPARDPLILLYAFERLLPIAPAIRP